ncbi:hypothetical protein WDW89_20355 [Deltaproteobacteria bacterium TL4]
MEVRGFIELESYARAQNVVIPNLMDWAFNQVLAGKSLSDLVKNIDDMEKETFL